MNPRHAQLCAVASFARALVGTRRREALAAALSALAHRATLLVVPLCARALVNGIARPRTALFLWTTGLLAAGAIAQAFAAFLSARANARLGDGLAADLRERLVGHLLSLPVQYVERERAGALATRVQHGFEGLLPFLVRSAVDALALVVVLAFVLPLLSFLDPVLTGLAVGFGIVVVGVVGRRLRASRDDFRRSTEAYAALTSALGEIIEGFRVIKGAVEEPAERSRYALRSQARAEASFAIAGREARSRLVSEALRGVLAATLLLVGALRVAHGTSSIGDLAAFGVLLGLLTTPLSSIAGQAPHVVRAFSALADARAFLDLASESSEGAGDGAASAGRPAGALGFERVSFAHPGGPDVVREVTIDITAGALVGVVGVSGAGKSTLLDLAARIHAPCSGRVLLDGADVRTLRLERYRSLVASVGQDVFLFDRSVRENVAYARPDASEANVREACEAANALSMIEALPEGFETRVGERGHRLSGGERQRLALARALLVDPVILLLDEVTSNLDPVSEAEIARALAAQKGRRTTIVVAHRVSFVREADVIFVMEGGAIADHGTHADLMSRAGRYRDMVAAVAGRASDEARLQLAT